jgi:hypothetical protein
MSKIGIPIARYIRMSNNTQEDSPARQREQTDPYAAAQACTGSPTELDSQGSAEDGVLRRGDAHHVHHEPELAGFLDNTTLPADLDGEACKILEDVRTRLATLVERIEAAGSV